MKNQNDVQKRIITKCLLEIDAITNKTLANVVAAKDDYTMQIEQLCQIKKHIDTAKASVGLILSGAI